MGRRDDRSRPEGARERPWGCAEQTVSAAFPSLLLLEEGGGEGELPESAVRYVRELHANDPVRVTFQLLDFDSKRFHYFEQLFHATEGWVSATSENMTLHVDMGTKKVAPFPDPVMRSLARMKAAHAQLPRPEAAGRRIAMPGR